MPLAKRWQDPPPLPPGHSQRAGPVPAFIGQILYNRGLVEPAEVAAFLSDQDQPLADPFLLKDMATAVGRVVEAIRRGELIFVFADFDADGITSAALLVTALRSLGACAEPYIPHRVEEGYGLNCGALQKIADRGAGLVITVDCGMGSSAEVTYANEHGLDVIITDHHHVAGHLPPARAVVNPHQPGCSYPFKYLAGVGVAFRLAQALEMRLRGEQCGTDGLVDLVALGSVADMVPLLGENRTLVKRGLRLLNPPARPGLRELLARSGSERVDAATIGFVLGPRLNAMGRLESAMTSYHLLVTDSPDEADLLAETLEDTNVERQSLTREQQDAARQGALDLGTEARLLMIAGSQYRAGVVGLVAGRLAEEFYRPAIVVELGETESRGSARSIPEFNIVAALDECDDLLVRYGGHAQAAGFTVDNRRLDELRCRLTAIAERELAGQTLQPTVCIDAELPLADTSWDALTWLHKLAPFGYANPSPVLLARRVRVAGPPRIVGNDHLKLRLTDPDGRVVRDAIGFRLGSWLEQITKHPYWDVVYQLESNQWGDRPAALQVNLKDLRPWRRDAGAA